MFCCEFCELFKKTYFVEDLQLAGSEIPVRGSLFNKVTSMTTWRLLAVLERDFRTGSSTWILRNFYEGFFTEHLATTSHIIFFSILQISEVCSLKPIYFVEQWQIRRRNSQAHSILSSYGNQMETSLFKLWPHMHLGIPIAGKVEEKEELENL